jgi:hypothetical protein
MSMLEVILHASSVIVSSSESAALGTAPVNDGLRSVTVSAAREESW